MNFYKYIILKKRYEFLLIILLVFIQIIFFTDLAYSSVIICNHKRIICQETEYQTAAYFYCAKSEGPNVMIISGAHGDELAGIEASKKFMNDLNLKRGSLIIIPEANKAAIKNRVRALSLTEDLNRNYPGDPASSGIKKLAGEIFEIMDNYNVDFLLDLHESMDYYTENTSCYGQTIVLDSDSNMFLQDISEYLSGKLNQSVIFPKDYFEVIIKPIEGCSTYEALNRYNIPGITFETCTKMDYNKRVEFHYKCIQNVLVYFDMISLPAILTK